MANVVNLRPPPPLTIQSRWSQKLSNGFLCTSFRSAENPNWRSLQLKLKCKGRVSALFSNNGREEQARKALESALGGKKSEFEKWNKEIQKREEMGGGGASGGGGWFGWKGWFGGGDHFWEEAQQTSLVVLVLIFVYLLIAKGETLLAIVFNPLLFGLRGVRNAFTFVTSNILRRLPVGIYSAPDNTATEEVVPRLSAKERVIRKWASD